jgi:hypothetical protein
MGVPAQVLAYLSRYTHRTAIGNERIKAITPSEFVFSARAKGQAGEQENKRTSTFRPQRTCSDHGSGVDARTCGQGMAKAGCQRRTCPWQRQDQRQGVGRSVKNGFQRIQK